MDGVVDGAEDVTQHIELGGIRFDGFNAGR